MERELSDSDLDKDDVDGDRLLFVLISEALNQRVVSVCRQRLNWEHREQQLQLEGKFERTYRMTVPLFERLLLLLENKLTVNKGRSQMCTGMAPLHQKSYSTAFYADSPVETTSTFEMLQT